MSYVYIASPYTHESEGIMIDRYMAAERYVAKLLLDGVMCFSPIVHNHHLAINHVMPKDSEFWRKHNYAMLSKASSLYVLRLPDWGWSKGVSDEIKFAELCGIPVEFKG